MQERKLEHLFEERTEDINSIFSSYRDLYDIYMVAMKNAQANPNTIEAVKNVRKTVDLEQRKISTRLYGQGFILLVGAAEALLKDVFDALLTENFSNMSIPNRINFSGNEVQEALNKSYTDGGDMTLVLAEELGALLKAKMHSEKNPAERLNLQNVRSMQDAFKKYFGIEIQDSDITKAIHRYWQVRHALLHNGGIIDERFVKNVEAVGLLESNESVGKQVKVTRKSYTEAATAFRALFSELSQLVISNHLSCSLIQEPRARQAEQSDLSQIPF